MKKYENPMLQVVSIKKNDIVTASPLGFDPNSSVTTEGGVGAASRFRDFEDYSY